MTNAAFSLLKHASDNRASWLKRFYAIGKEAVRPRKDRELQGYLIIPNGNYQKNDYDYSDPLDENLPFLLKILKRGNVETEEINRIGTNKYPEKTIFVPLDQPYGSFAKALLEKQSYPKLLNEAGEPLPPYDVTAHTLPLLMGVNVKEVFSPAKLTVLPPPRRGIRTLYGDSTSATKPVVLEIDSHDVPTIYQSHIPSMDEGWTRWIFEEWQYKMYGSITNELIRQNKFVFPTNHDCTNKTISCIKNYRATSIIFPDQSPNQILNGYRERLNARRIHGRNRQRRRGKSAEICRIGRHTRFLKSRFGFCCRTIRSCPSAMLQKICRARIFIFPARFSERN